MKLGHSADEIKYLDTTGTVARYALVLDEEPTMHITCDTAEAEKVIRIGRPNGTGFQGTNGRFTTTADFLEGPNGEPLGVQERVDEKSVYTYVIPRLHVLLGRLLRAAA